MALQNVRALMWRGEDLGFGGGNTRELITSTQVAASARPLLVTQSFTTTQDISPYLSASTGPRGQIRSIMNRSPRYFITLKATLEGSLVEIPIAPLQTLYLPQTITAPASLVINSTRPIPVPASGASSATMLLATGMTAITADIMVER